MPFSIFNKVLNPSHFDMNGVALINAQYMQSGDPLKGMQTNGKEVMFYPTTLVNGNWYKVGTFAVSTDSAQAVEFITSGGITKIPVSVRCSASGTLSVDVSSGNVITTDSGKYQIGYRLNNSDFDASVEYPCIDVYVKRAEGVARTLYCYNMRSNYMAKISRDGDMLTVLTSTSDSPNIVCTIDCDNSTVTN